ncbi:N-acetylmuramate alpha-1-phosphate uridylyltransferase MurU [Pandoraea sputorum]|uniref:N-acetylmuramate alpha-1-phosphate uridylyltransferase MurU n=1 Tax=Pandoraea sputorum TaxID=93222 RepID=UPI001242E90E|nr:nucleotidyltransferase family protein [Pandoraea sputorum]VVE84877.1 mannose-1-phosphate guanylyltransferase [Pandoraea sputorum]
MKAMIFAAGRGERMRPLTDAMPKPLLTVGGKPIIVWQIEALARAGFTQIVINHAWLGAQIEATLGDGSAFGVHLAYSAEAEALETAGGIAQARALLEGDGNVLLAVSGDIFTDFDYATLRAQAERLAAQPTPGMHLVMVPNPAFHPTGDFALDAAGHLFLRDAAPATAESLTFGNIALYDLRLFDGIAPGTRMALTPLYQRAIAAGHASGERFDGIWENVGTPAQLDALDAEVRAGHARSPGSRIA